MGKQRSIRNTTYERDDKHGRFRVFAPYKSGYPQEGNECCKESYRNATQATKQRDARRVV